MANSASHAALPYPIKGARFTIPVPYLDADGDPTDPTTPDTELSKDGAAFADAAEEVTTITGSNGSGYITLTGAETDCSLIVACAKVASGPKATLATLNPRILAEVGTGTLSAGSAGGGTLGTLLAYDVTGCFIKTTGGTGGGGTGGASNQARKIVTYNTGTGAFTVVPDWETTPDSTTTYAVLLPEGVTLGMLRTLNPTTAGRTLDVSSTGEAGLDWANVGGATTAVNLSGTTVNVVNTATAVTTVNGLAANVITAAATAADFGTEIGTAVWATAARTLTAATNITDTGGTLNIDASGNVFLADGAHGGTSMVLTAERIIVASTTGNEPGFKITGNGSAAGILSTGGATGDGVKFVGGATGGHGAYFRASAGDNNGIYTQGSNGGDGAHFEAGATGKGMHVNGTLVVAGATTFTGAVGLSSTLTVTGATSLAALGMTTLTASGAVALQSTVTVTGATTLTGAVSLGSTLTVTGAATFSDTTNGTLGAILADLEDGGRTDLLIDGLIADSPNRPTRTVQFDLPPFMMVDETDGYSPETGVTVTATISKDGAAFAACTNSVSEISGGYYKITLTATEMTATTIALKFTGTGCRQTNISFTTQPT